MTLSFSVEMNTSIKILAWILTIKRVKATQIYKSVAILFAPEASLWLHLNSEAQSRSKMRLSIRKEMMIRAMEKSNWIKPKRRSPDSSNETQI